MSLYPVALGRCEEPWQRLASALHSCLQSRLSAGITQEIVSVVKFEDRCIIKLESVLFDVARQRRIDSCGGGTFYSNGQCH